MKKVFAAALWGGVAALALSGCAVGDAANSSSNLQQELDHKADHMKEPGGDFLPAYLDMLQGKQPFPQDRCHPQNLHDLLIPCDEGGRP